MPGRDYRVGARIHVSAAVPFVRQRLHGVWRTSGQLIDADLLLPLMLQRTGLPDLFKEFARQLRVPHKNDARIKMPWLAIPSYPVPAHGHRRAIQQSEAQIHSRLDDERVG